MDFSKIFGGDALTLEQFLEKTKGVKFADLSQGEYVSKSKYDADIAKKDKELETAKGTISNLEKTGADAEAMQKELETYKKAEEDRKKQDEAAAAEKANSDRFNAVIGDKKWASDYAKKGVYQDFIAAINDPSNVGKGDSALFESLVKDKPGIFENSHKGVNMGGFGTKTGNGGMTKEAIMAIKDKDERRKAIAANLDLFE